jgi:hypothetical protein
MEDFVVLDIAVHLAASRKITYRTSVITMFQSLALFLKENDLAAREIPSGRDFPSGTFKLMRSDLTDCGYRLIQNSLDRWMKGIVAGKWSASDTSMLAKELAKSREKI